jgi:hypothetical protein
MHRPCIKRRYHFRKSTKTSQKRHYRPWRSLFIQTLISRSLSCPQSHHHCRTCKRPSLHCTLDEQRSLRRSHESQKQRPLSLWINFSSYHWNWWF